MTHGQLTALDTWSGDGLPDVVTDLQSDLANGRLDGLDNLFPRPNAKGLSALLGLASLLAETVGAGGGGAALELDVEEVDLGGREQARVQRSLCLACRTNLDVPCDTL